MLIRGFGCYSFPAICQGLGTLGTILHKKEHYIAKIVCELLGNNINLEEIFPEFGVPLDIPDPAFIGSY